MFLPVMASAASWRSDQGSQLTIEATGCMYYAPITNVRVVGSCRYTQTGGAPNPSYAVDIEHMRVGRLNHFRFGVILIPGSRDIWLQMPGAPGMVRMQYLGGPVIF